MTSDAKGNHRRMLELMESVDWFGRGKDSFRLFRQPLVPVISVEDGQWLLSDAMQLMAKPGGHGAIWKLMRDEGVFAWLQQQGRKAALVRQISNPMAGTDTTLLALAGRGQQQRSSFGFMSCDRAVGAAEGCNALQERKRWEGQCTLMGGLVVSWAVTAGSSEQLMPGLIFNRNKAITYKDPLRGTPAQRMLAGRMECTMQNIADYMTDRKSEALQPTDPACNQLSTFLVYNERRKVTSSAKKRREQGSTKISQTPDGSFYDLQVYADHALGHREVAASPAQSSTTTAALHRPLRRRSSSSSSGSSSRVLNNISSSTSSLRSSSRGSSRSPSSSRSSSSSPTRSLPQASVLGDAHEALSHLQGTGSSSSSEAEALSTANGAPMSPLCPSAPSHSIHSHPLQHSSIADGSNYAGSGDKQTNIEDEATSRRGGRESEMPQLQQPVGHVMEVGVCNGAHAHANAHARTHTSAHGHASQHLVYSSSSCGRLRLRNVAVVNRGVDWGAPDNVYWKHQVERNEALHVHLRGRSEFEAHDVTIQGNHTFEVPDGHQDVSGKLKLELIAATAAVEP
ncbi:nucleotide-diphospho-sugar transferase [Dunaliella salina]|uniref:Nucleotide-diphospho-sugar transferase n=1 Tax=Dunaliella salina TaxID=3046 RepID=A0ABQ7GT84_DUNSA|nr:nucleotide-diphospho-sugar transferase [Dunaliella salina]|eukprot:KAF5837813.1 nucleotide-diphospho-sugar transferase [Dunaliella salina]